MSDNGQYGASYLQVARLARYLHRDPRTIERAIGRLVRDERLLRKELALWHDVAVLAGLFARCTRCSSGLVSRRLCSRCKREAWPSTENPRRGIPGGLRTHRHGNTPASEWGGDVQYPRRRVRNTPLIMHAG